MKRWCASADVFFALIYIWGTSGLHLAPALQYWAVHERDNMCVFARERKGRSRESMFVSVLCVRECVRDWLDGRINEQANDCAEKRAVLCVCVCVIWPATNDFNVRVSSRNHHISDLFYKENLIFHAICSAPVTIR